ncbi:hypothetical protein K490DRAFT_52965 [Saccharata proteae CBS 121410]|uniref:Uncharacterized protein n=1 Tax=Saccharata proteae CBS 121410 TaxID=1314787 RepID=A0A9P4LYN5_9PEZI|nr:hypothetical protein K490DRAFT_52965 [Saccharata proteae CBS 121410]
MSAEARRLWEEDKVNLLPRLVEWARRAGCSLDGADEVAFARLQERSIDRTNSTTITCVEEDDLDSRTPQASMIIEWLDGQGSEETLYMEEVECDEEPEDDQTLCGEEEFEGEGFEEIEGDRSNNNDNNNLNSEDDEDSWVVL